MFSFGLTTVVTPELPMGVFRLVLIRSFRKAITSSFGSRSVDIDDGLLTYLIL